MGRIVSTIHRHGLASMRVPFSDRTEISKLSPDSALSLPQLTDIIVVAIIAFKHATDTEAEFYF
jgi:hypothetical protein